MIAPRPDRSLLTGPARAHRAPLLVALASLLWLATVASDRAQDVAAPAAADLVSRFLARTDEPLTQYRAFRRLEARNARFDLEGWLEANTELSPRAGFTYAVTAEGGSGVIRKKVLRASLDGEAKLIRGGDPARAALTRANYDLAPGSDAPDGYPRLLIRPRRKDLLLVKGEIVLKADDADLVRLEGDLSRNPSWWTTRVHVRREYVRVAGVRVPHLITSTAQVRLAGASEFRMTYRYEMVNGREVRDTSPPP